MTALMTVLAGGNDRPLFEIEDQPGDCSPGCPCETDGSDYGARWVPVRERRGRDAARLMYQQARNVLAVISPDSDGDIFLAHRLLALDVGEDVARRLLADPAYSLPANNPETTRP
ncbi:hypothetical protein [Alloactinosynnema sp. L-07]|uniref:hypothetical protein n=1 Tax=Alloactinosynnema sp. L-07 TaxID=1653480 RepID=UPI00065F0321|nr:hypothetical protein [Alloactinosynnema sp. L-07]CRK59023.1 hypothetical protein [Alloactinosynnema sp. L-07]